MYHIFFIHSSVEGCLDCFQVLAIINNAVMNIVVQMSLWYGSASFGHMPRSGIALQLTSLRQDLSLNLELGWTVSPDNPPVSAHTLELGLLPIPVLSVSQDLLLGQQALLPIEPAPQPGRRDFCGAACQQDGARPRWPSLSRRSQECSWNPGESRMRRRVFQYLKLLLATLFCKMWEGKLGH